MGILLMEGEGEGEREGEREKGRENSIVMCEKRGEKDACIILACTCTCIITCTCTCIYTSIMRSLNCYLQSDCGTS